MSHSCFMLSFYGFEASILGDARSQRYPFNPVEEGLTGTDFKKLYIVNR